MPKTLSLPIAAAAGLLSTAALALAPAAAPAAQSVGSPLTDAASASWVACGPGGPQAPCTYVADKRGYAMEVYVDSGSVLTSWSALLAPGSRARLVTLRRSDDRTAFTVVSKGEVVTGSGAGGVQRFPSALRVAEPGLTIGVELQSGAIGAGPSEEYGWAAFSPALGDGETRAPNATTQTELMLGATAESDWDGDGLGDETQDPDRGFPPREEPGGGGSGGGGTGGGDTGGGTGGGDTGGGDDSGGTGGGGSGDGGNGPIGKPSVTIEPRAILRGAAAGAAGYISVYARNPNTYDVEGWIQVKLGKKLLGRGDLEIERQSSYSWGMFRLPPDARRRLLRRGSLKVTAIARISAAVGPAVTVRRTVTVLRGGASGYDGTYRGPGPVVFTVERGAIFAVSYPLNLFCTRSKKFMQRAMTTVPGFPVLLRKDGSFDARGSSSGDTLVYRGRFTKRGTGKGYLSMWHTELWTDGGFLQSDQCFDARRWTVKRDR
jgi:uncharacterized membrane protein YgcG